MNKIDPRLCHIYRKIVENFSCIRMLKILFGDVQIFICVSPRVSRMK